jgi:hypothetical protein
MLSKVLSSLKNVLFSQVSVNHFWVADDPLRGILCNFLPVMENDDMISKTDHCTHDMLDPKDGNLQVVSYPPDQFHGGYDFGGIQTTDHLI